MKLYSVLYTACEYERAAILVNLSLLKTLLFSSQAFLKKVAIAPNTASLRGSFNPSI